MKPKFCEKCGERLTEISAHHGFNGETGEPVKYTVMACPYHGCASEKGLKEWLSGEFVCVLCGKKSHKHVD